MISERRFVFACEAGWVTSEILRSKATATLQTQTKGASLSIASVAVPSSAHTHTHSKTHSLFRKQTERGGSTRSVTRRSRFPSGSFPAPHWVLSPRALKWQPDKLVLKKPRGNQSTPLAHNYLSFNKAINALSESDRCKLGHAKIDSLVGWVNLWNM